MRRATLENDVTAKAPGAGAPRGVNVIRSFPGRRICVWGARTMSSNALWKQVSAQRLFVFLERSIYERTQWVVFEPNDIRLCARVTDTIRLLLRGQWRLGALFGRTEEQAFSVTCDETMMTQDDILNGRLTCEIGIAPVRPAKFVGFRSFLHTVESAALTGASYGSRNDPVRNFWFRLDMDSVTPAGLRGRDR